MLTRAFHRINPCLLCRAIRLARLQNTHIIMRVQFWVAEKPRFGCPLGLLLIRLAMQKKFCKNSKAIVRIYYSGEVLGHQSADLR
jgi:hypothetical protein